MQSNHFRTVKSKLGFIAALAVLGIVLHLGTVLFAKNGSTSVPRPTSKIAVVNIQVVLEKYDRFVNYKKELEAFIKKYQVREEVIKANAVKEKEKLEKAPAANKDAIDKAMAVFKGQLEDLGKEFKEALAKKQKAELVGLYRQIEDAVKGIARASGFEIVLQYNELINPNDAYDPALVAQKVHPGVCMPMYVSPGLDITDQVIEKLNRAYKNSKK